MKLPAAIVAGLLVLGVLETPADASAAPPEASARLLVRGDAHPGAELDIQVELSWDGRPELLRPGVPDVAVPDGAALRLGRTGSRFDGDRSVWWTNGTVTLPDSAGPWELGPAAVPATTADGSTARFRTPARAVGARRSRSLLGRGLGGAVLLAAALLLLGRTWRRLLAEESAPPAHAAPAATLSAALESGHTEDAIAASLALFDVLDHHPVASEYLGPRAPLEEQLDALRFAHEAPPLDAVRAQARPLLAIAGALDAPARRT